MAHVIGQLSVNAHSNAPRLLAATTQALGVPNQTRSQFVKTCTRPDPPYGQLLNVEGELLATSATSRQVIPCRILLLACIEAQVATTYQDEAKHPGKGLILQVMQLPPATCDELVSEVRPCKPLVPTPVGEPECTAAGYGPHPCLFWPATT